MKELIASIADLMVSAKLPIPFSYGRAPREVEKPYITYTVDSRSYENSMSELGDLATLTINVWSANESVDEVILLGDEVLSRLDGALIEFENNDYYCVRVDRESWSVLPVDELGGEVGWRATIEYQIYYTHKTD